ncbi:MAG: AI-2E family transporter [Verrucomicrobiota bacterium]
MGAIAVGGVFLVSWGLGYLQPVLVPVAVAAILAYLLEPVIIWLVKRGLARDRAVYTVFVSFLSFLLLLAFLVIYPTVRQAKKFSAEYLAEVPVKVEEGIPGTTAEAALTETKLEQKLNDVLHTVDERIGNFTFVQRFKTEDNTWDIATLSGWVWDNVSGFVDEVAVFFGRGFSSAASVLGYLLGFFLVPIYLFFFLRESTSIAQNWSDYVPLRKSKFKDELVDVLREINQYLIAYFRGQMLVSMIDALLVTIALSFMGLPYALLLGVFLAILGLIPYVGSLIVLIPTVIITLVHFGSKTVVSAADLAGREHRIHETILDAAGNPTSYEIYTNTWNWLPTQVGMYAVIVLLLFVVLQQINGLVTAPKIVGDSVGLHPITVIFSMLFWGLLLGGLLGALLAVPLTAAVKVLFRRYIWERRIQPGMSQRLAGDDANQSSDNRVEDSANDEPSDS